MAMSKRTRIVLIVIVVAVVAYFVWRWWSNRQSSGTTDTTGTGSNLNSLAPELVAGSAGPSSGLSYTPGSTQVDLTLPGGGPSQDVTGNDTGSQDNEDVDVGTPSKEPCPLGSRRNPKTGMCEPIKCPSGQQLDFHTQRCVPIPKPKPKKRPPPRKRKPPVRVPPHWIPPPQGAQHGAAV